MVEAPAFVAGFDDVAVMGQAVEHGGGHLGIDVKTVATRARHADVSTTLKNYVHDDPTLQKAAAVKIDATLRAFMRA